MRRFGRWFGFAMLLSAQSVNAQSNLPPLGDSVYRQMRSFAGLVKGGSLTPHWMADGRSFWYVDGGPAAPAFHKVDPAANTDTPLFDVARLRAALTEALGHRPPFEGAPFDTFEFADGETAATFTVENRRFRLDLATYRLTSLGPAPAPVAPPPAGSAPEQPAPRGGWTALVQGFDIALRSSADGRTVRLTTDGVERYGWSLPPGAWQAAGTYLSPPGAWHPAGTYLIALRTDARAVHHMPVLHWLKPQHEEITWSPYAGPGEAAEATELWVLSVSGGRVRIPTGDADGQTIAPLGWRPDGSEFVFLLADRLFKRVDLMAATPDGRVRTILTEKQETFIEGLAFGTASRTMYNPLADGSRFVWRSERDGWSHLYLYDARGTLIRRLTAGATPVERVDAIDEKGGWVYYTAHGDPKRPYDEQVYRVDLEGQRSARLVEATGVHAAAFAPGKGFFLDTHSTVDRAPVVDLRRADGTLVRTMTTADISGLKALGWRAPEEFVVKAADGKTDLYGSLYTPHDFDPSRRYPVVDLQYMGNFVHSAPRTFSGTWLGDDAQSLTQLGFVVYIVDARGTPGRGKAFQDQTWMNVGKIEIPDHIVTLRQLAATRPYMDTTRVGITGYSWGGYFTIRALLTAPDVFKVGVAGAPVVDFIAHHGPIEPYIGTPESNPDGYEQGSNVRLADRLRGRLMVTIGTTDVNVTFNHTMRLADAFIKAGKFFDLVVFPEQTHGLTPPAMAYYNEARNRYLLEHLGPPTTR